jgi:hypothetical protein
MITAVKYFQSANQGVVRMRTKPESTLRGHEDKSGLDILYGDKLAERIIPDTPEDRASTKEAQEQKRIGHSARKGVLARRKHRAMHRNQVKLTARANIEGKWNRKMEEDKA